MYYGLNKKQTEQAKSRFASSAASLSVSEKQRDEIAAKFQKCRDERMKKKNK
jgi:hypothetical protein